MLWRVKVLPLAYDEGLWHIYESGVGRSLSVCVRRRLVASDRS